MAGHGYSGAPETEPGPRGLWLGILAYRWATFTWMAILAVATRDDVRSGRSAEGLAGAQTLPAPDTGVISGPVRSAELGTLTPGALHPPSLRFHR